jgi:hypothetical protein
MPVSTVNIRFISRDANSFPLLISDYQYTRLLSHLIIALVTSLTFLQLGNQARELQYRVFAIFIVTVLPALVSGVMDFMCRAI